MFLTGSHDASGGLVNRHGDDLGLFGRDHLDYMIAVPLSAIRAVDRWRRSKQLGAEESPGVDTMVDVVGLPRDHANRLHELMVRSRRFSRLGVTAYAPPLPRIGMAVPRDT